MSRRPDSLLLADISEAIERITSYLQGLSVTEFLTDRRTQDAVIRNLEVIGEAVKLLSDASQAAYPDVPWRLMARSRDRLIHGYFGVNLDIVWHIAATELPRVAMALSRPDAPQKPPG